MNAHLVLDRAAGDGVAVAQRTVLVHQELGDDEQRDAFDVVRRPGDLGEHQVDNVLGQVMLTRGDEDLRTGKLVAAVFLRVGASLQQSQVRAAMRLGQVHGTGPFTGDHVGQIFRLLLVRALHQDGGDRTLGQPVVHFEAVVG
jgi:hypothetical protein